MIRKEGGRRREEVGERMEGRRKKGWREGEGRNDGERGEEGGRIQGEREGKWRSLALQSLSLQVGLDRILSTSCLYADLPLPSSLTLQQHDRQRSRIQTLHADPRSLLCHRHSHQLGWLLSSPVGLGVGRAPGTRHLEVEGAAGLPRRKACAV